MMLNFMSYTLHGREYAKSFDDVKDQQAWMLNLVVKNRLFENLTFELVVEHGRIKICSGIATEEDYAEDGHITNSKNYQLHAV